MKTLIRIVLFCLCLGSLLFGGVYGCNAQVPTSPTYTGTLTSKVLIPAVIGGKQYKITGDRVGGSGVAIEQVMDSIQASLSGLQGVVLQSGIYAWTGDGTTDSINVNFTPLGVGVHYHAIPISRSFSPPYWISTYSNGSFVIRYANPPANGESIVFDWAIIKQF